MKFAALALAALAAASAGSAAALDTFIKAEGRWRQSHVIDRGQTEMTKVPREAHHEARRNRLAAN